MTPERIAELRRITKTVRNEHARMDLKTQPHAFVLVDEIDALLAECERVSRLEELLKAGRLLALGITNHQGGEVRVAFSKDDERREFHNLLAALTPPQQAGAQP